MQLDDDQIGCPPDHDDVKSVTQQVYLPLFTLCQYNVPRLGAMPIV